MAGLALAACGSDDVGAPTDTFPVAAATPAPSTSEPPDAPPDDPVPATTAPRPPDPSPGTDGGGSAVVPAEVPAVLRFSAPLVGGGDIELSTLAGRPVLLWFWAPW